MYSNKVTKRKSNIVRARIEWKIKWKAKPTYIQNTRYGHIHHIVNMMCLSLVSTQKISTLFIGSERANHLKINRMIVRASDPPIIILLTYWLCAAQNKHSDIYDYYWWFLWARAHFFHLYDSSNTWMIFLITYFHLFFTDSLRSTSDGWQQWRQRRRQQCGRDCC